MGRSKQAQAYETRECILDAVASCLADTDYDRIRTKDVMEKAHVSHTTFYRYFFSVDHALDELEDSYLDAIMSINRAALTSKLGKGSVELTPTVVMRLEILQRNREATLALLGPHANPRFLTKEKGLMQSYFHEKLQGSALNERELDLYISFLVSGHNELIRSWLTDYPEASPEEVGALLNRLFYAPLLEPNR